jgi:hypothetical protein
MSARPFRPALAALVAILLGAACADREPLTAPVGPATQAPRSADLLGLGDLLGNASRLVCPASASAAGSAVIGPDGGTLVANGVRVDFPAGAVAESQTFTAQVVPGSYVEVDLAAQGHAHYNFAVPVTVTLDLQSCVILPLGARAFYVESGALVEDMGGDLDLLGRTIRFRTPHFSGYTVAW